MVTTKTHQPYMVTAPEIDRASGIIYCIIICEYSHIILLCYDIIILL